MPAAWRDGDFLGPVFDPDVSESVLKSKRSEYEAVIFGASERDISDKLIRNERTM